MRYLARRHRDRKRQNKNSKTIRKKQTHQVNPFRRIRKYNKKMSTVN